MVPICTMTGQSTYGRILISECTGTTAVEILSYGSCSNSTVTWSNSNVAWSNSTITSYRVYDDWQAVIKKIKRQNSFQQFNRQAPVQGGVNDARRVSRRRTRFPSKAF